MKIVWPKRKSSDAPERFISVPLVLTIIVTAVLGVGVLALGDYHTHLLAANSVFWPYVKAKVCEVVGATLVATAILYLFTELGAVRREIDGYFFRAFTSNSYVETIDATYKDGICRNLIKNLYGRTLPKDLLSVYVERLSKAAEIPLIYDFDVNVEMTINADQSIEQITIREYTIKDLPKVKNLSEILKDTYSKGVHFTDEKDSFALEELTIWLNGTPNHWSAADLTRVPVSPITETAATQEAKPAPEAPQKAAVHPAAGVKPVVPAQPGGTTHTVAQIQDAPVVAPTLVTEAAKTGTPAALDTTGYNKTVPFNWELLPRGKELKLQPGAEATIETREVVRVTKWDRTNIFRLRQNCRGFRVKLTVHSAGDQPKIHGTLMGENLEIKDIYKKVTADSITLEIQQKWLTKGGGYLLFVN